MHLCSGETTAEAFHQSYSLGEFHFSSCVGRTRQRYAKYVEIPMRSTWQRLKGHKINTRKDILERVTMAGMNSLTRQKYSVSSELCKHLA